MSISQTIALAGDQATLVEGQAWAKDAVPLTEWVVKYLCNRNDAWGGYHFQDGKKTPTTHKGKLSKDVIKQHFSATTVNDIIGLHTIAYPDNTCRWIAHDIDAHKEGADSSGNFEWAKALYKAYRSRGYLCLLFQAKKHNYQVGTIVINAVPSTDAFALAHSVTAAAGVLTTLKYSPSRSM